MFPLLFPAHLHNTKLLWEETCITYSPYHRVKFSFYDRTMQASRAPVHSLSSQPRLFLPIHALQILLTVFWDMRSRLLFPYLQAYKNAELVNHSFQPLEQACRPSFLLQWHKIHSLALSEELFSLNQTEHRGPRKTEWRKKPKQNTFIVLYCQYYNESKLVTNRRSIPLSFILIKLHCLTAIKHYHLAHGQSVKPLKLGQNCDENLIFCR